MAVGSRLVLEYSVEQTDHVMHLAKVRRAVAVCPAEQTATGYWRITLERTE